MKGTFFVTMDNIRHRLSDWERMARQGHELADHTVSHPCDLGPFSASSYARRELYPMERWLRKVDPQRRVSTFAYPCDVTDLGPGDANAQERRFDRLLARIGIQAARTSQGEPNRPATALKRPHRLQALAVGYDARDSAAVDAYLGHAAAQGYWAILVFHDIVAQPTQEGETSDALHNEILDAVGAHRLWAAPLGTVFEWLKRHQ
jgi:peptidoglycan/xylan/chitin deacetylase (PgdA/CDA1 family)